MNHSNVNPCLTRLWQRFVVFAQSPASAQPRQRALNDPTAGQHVEMMAISRTPDNLQKTSCHGQNPGNQLPSIASIRPDHREPRIPSQQFAHHQLGPIPILDIRRMHHHGQQQSYGVYHNVPLPPRHLLASVIPARPPFSVVFTDWLSMIAALGVGSLPSASRTWGRRVSWIRSHVPPRPHVRKYLYTVSQGGRSCGIIRHGHPDRRTYRMPLSTSRRSTVRGLPPGLAPGSHGASSSHWASVKSLGYLLRCRPRVSSDRGEFIALRHLSVKVSLFVSATRPQLKMASA